ncbi:sorting nexin-41 [Lichtheimia corymbifera JMRC:FSU:9682]|uniref:Sorting nexin-41 n=1 Tax=Lichtheimia corymbifera JMRC:FSU:9682 TaxID=1263082 RepID=A0A068RWK8_9FUNG|nr:sorting nexin-41 [Lichtheimia corymbifera JMRC:FSU:9682]
MSCACAIGQALQQHGDTITITNAQKQTIDKTTFVVYTVCFQEQVAKRRYSDFDSFRTALTRLYPDVLVPPIPEKHSLSEYTQQVHGKDDQPMIDKRKRMLQRFLLRLAKHPRLCHEHLFHRFLEHSVSWSEVELPPASIDKLPSMHDLKEPDSRFADMETAAEKHADLANTQVDRSQRKALRRMRDLSSDYAELGAAYHMLSQNEADGQIAGAMERISMAADTTCGKTKHMVHELEVSFAEHMQEYAQYTLIAKQVLRYRHAKHAQLELIGVSLTNKKSMLHDLLQTETKAMQIENAMNNNDISSSSSHSPLSSSPPLSAHRPTLSAHQPHEHESDPNFDDDDEDDDTRSVEDGFSAIEVSPSSPSDPSMTEYPSSLTASAIRASRDRYRKWSSPRKLFNAVSYTLQGMIDVDPEATRRNQINKLKESVAQLEKDQVRVRQELKDISQTIEQELETFQRQRANDLRTMMIAFAKMHLQFCEENVTTWQKAREQVDEIQTESC